MLLTFVLLQQHLGMLDLELVNVQDNLLGRSLDIQVDLDSPLIAIRATQLKIGQRDGIIDWLHSDHIYKYIISSVYSLEQQINLRIREHIAILGRHAGLMLRGRR